MRDDSRSKTVIPHLCGDAILSRRYGDPVRTNQLESLYNISDASRLSALKPDRLRAVLRTALKK
jgi:hypothetical protein